MRVVNRVAKRMTFQPVQFSSPAIVFYRSELLRALTINHVISNEVRDLRKGTLYVSNEGDFALRSKRLEALVKKIRIWAKKQESRDRFS